MDRIRVNRILVTCVRPVLLKLLAQPCHLVVRGWYVRYRKAVVLESFLLDLLLALVSYLFIGDHLHRCLADGEGLAPVYLRLVHSLGVLGGHFVNLDHLFLDQGTPVLGDKFHFAVVRIDEGTDLVGVDLALN